MRIFPNTNNLPIEILKYRFSTADQVELRHIATEDGSQVSHLLIDADMTDAEILALLTPTTEQEASDVSAYHIDRADLKAKAVTAIARLNQIQTAVNPTTAQIIAAIKDMAMYEKEIIKIIVRII